MPSARSLAGRLDTVRQDARFALRALRRTPLANGVMVASVALGVGVATAVFTLADVMLLRPLAYEGAEQLVVPYQTVTVRSRASQDTVPWSFGRYNVLRRVARGFEDAGFATWLDAVVRTANADVPVRVEAITPTLLSTFNLHVQAGRAFGSDEDAPTTAATVGTDLGSPRADAVRSRWSCGRNDPHRDRCAAGDGDRATDGGADVGASRAPAGRGAARRLPDCAGPVVRRGRRSRRGRPVVAGREATPAREADPSAHGGGGRVPAADCLCERCVDPARAWPCGADRAGFAAGDILRTHTRQAKGDGFPSPR